MYPAVAYVWTQGMIAFTIGYWTNVVISLSPIVVPVTKIVTEKPDLHAATVGEK